MITSFIFHFHQRFRALIYFKSDFKKLFSKYICFDTYKKNMTRALIFHPIWMGVFSWDSSLKELSEVCKQIWRSSYRFWDIRGLKGPMPKIITFLFYCVQQNHCVQQITVSNTELVSALISILPLPRVSGFNIAGPFRQRQFRLALVCLFSLVDFASHFNATFFHLFEHALDFSCYL